MSGLSRRELLVAGAAASLAGTLAPGALGSTPSAWLRRSAHTGLEGTTYGAGGVPLRLVSVDGTGEDAFALQLAGPPGLTGGIHELSHPTLGRFALLLGPVGPAGAEQVYEVVVDRRAAPSRTPAPGGAATGSTSGDPGGASGTPPGGARTPGDSGAGGAPSGGAGDATSSSGSGGPTGSASPDGRDAGAGGSSSDAAASPTADGRRAPAPLVRSASAALRGDVLAADVRVAPGRGLTGVRVRLLHGEVVVATGARRLAGRTKVRLTLRRVRRVPAGELWLEVTVTGRAKATTRRRISVR